MTITRPTIVCLCGSTRFMMWFHKATRDETLAGRIVLSVGVDMKTDAALFETMTPDELDKVKEMLDELHLSKIDMADEVLIVNYDDYVGDSTRREIEYAKQQGKTIRYMFEG